MRWQAHASGRWVLVPRISRSLGRIPNYQKIMRWHSFNGLIKFHYCRLKIFVPVALLSWAILVPVNWTNNTLAKSEAADKLQYSNIDKLSISNVPFGSPRLDILYLFIFKFSQVKPSSRAEAIWLLCFFLLLSFFFFNICKPILSYCYTSSVSFI